jgi:eukaryotic-like serine/threonine-protein kinase
MSTVPRSTEQDERLAALLAEFAQRQMNGEVPDLEAAAHEHPDLADELRVLWATAQFASAFVRPLSATAPAEDRAATPLPAPDSFGDYEIFEELGRGGMGVVYRARQKSLNRQVAIKMMRDARLASETDRARFRAEAGAAAKLKHPNIVTVHEVGEHDGQPYFAMEFVDGLPLSRQIAEHGPMQPREAARLVADIARAVQHAHEQGILHRDLKPANILLDAENGARKAESTSHGGNRPAREAPLPNVEFRAPKVSDFGLAKRLAVGSGSIGDNRTQTGAIVGTPSYMAPEQATGRKDLSAAADVWSLGAILYELLTGRPPFQAASPVDTLLLVIEQEPVPPRWLDPGIDRDLEMICLKCLQKPPQLRYATAGELARDLEAFVAGESLSAQPSGLSYFFSRMLRETHHAEVLENWGLLWMWHSLAVFVLCLLTQVLDWAGVHDHLTYLILWSVGLITWGTILWQLRRRAGPVLFVERQIAHAWAAGVCASIGMFVIEVLIDLPVLQLSPAIAIAAGMVFIFKAGIVSGRFYITATVMFATAIVMSLVPRTAILLFGIVSALSFFLPGLKYYRLRRQALLEKC